MRPVKKIVCLILCWSWSILAVAAVSTDPSNNLPITVTSNAWTGNMQQGTMVYSGNVLAVQGTRRLQGDTLTIQRGSNGQIQSFLLQGNPAKTQEQPSPSSQIAYGQAAQIYYFPAQNLIRYVKNARFTQGGNVFSGDVITYKTLTQVASSPKVPGGTGTTTIILPAYTQGKGSTNS